MMYSVTLIVSMLAAASAASGSKGGPAKFYTPDKGVQKYMWESYKRDYFKKYSSAEEDKTRFENFVRNLQQIDQRNVAELKAGGANSARHGITAFTDLSMDEFRAKYLNAKRASVDPSSRAPPVKIDTAVDTTSGLVSWVGIYTTPVKNQGYCGSCWAFSATEQIESDTMRTQATTYILSPEQITQCATAAYGCNGGWTEVAYDYVKKAGGIVTDADYPYTSYYGVTGVCKVNLSEAVVTVLSYSTVANGESGMASYMQTTGPISVCLDASSWNSYTGGIMYVCGQDVDHCVQAVGVDTTDPAPYWLVRNSWGTSWGENGYIQLAYGNNTCNITNDPTVTSVKLV